MPRLINNHNLGGHGVDFPLPHCHRLETFYLNWLNMWFTAVLVCTVDLIVVGNIIIIMKVFIT